MTSWQHHCLHSICHAASNIFDDRRCSNKTHHITWTWGVGRAARCKVSADPHNIIQNSPFSEVALVSYIASSKCWCKPQTSISSSPHLRTIPQSLQPWFELSSNQFSSRHWQPRRLAFWNVTESDMTSTARFRFTYSNTWVYMPISNAVLQLWNHEWLK